MRTRQTGITFIGWLVLLLPVALVLYTAIRVTPIYLNYMKVAKAIEQTASEYRGESDVNAHRIRVALEKRFDIDSINHPKANEIIVRKEGGGWAVEADYEDIAPLFANASLLLTFDKVVLIE
jgi:hypothetical protein